jgi:hypothetical protein
MSASAIFMARRIIAGRNTYTEVVTARPDLKSDIDQYLIENGHPELIV